MILFIPALLYAGYTMARDYNSSFQANESANRANAQNYQIWREQANMAASAHQTEVKDLQAAGLNPTLSAGGNGAPQPSAPTMQPAPPINAPDIMPAINLLMETKRLDLEQQKVQNQTDLTKAEIGKKSTDTKKSEEDINLKKRDLHRGHVLDEFTGAVNEMVDWLKSKTNKPFDKMKMPKVPGKMTSPNLHPGL